MVAIYTNQTKNVSTETNGSFSNYAVWDDNAVAWDSAYIAWDAFRGDAYVTQTKNISAETNQIKN